ncbi:MAG: electron transport complex subunit RsxC [Bacillota bacterium]|nr:electron transport complex subunit RsxC [Bacillota bacterium]
MGLFSFKGGIHPPGSKLATESSAIENFPTPTIVEIPIRQHIGAPCEPLVKKGDPVKMGQLIAKAGSFVSANIHASVSGTVRDVKKMDTPYGPDSVVVIENDGLDTLADEIVVPPDYRSLSRQEIVGLIQNAGLVGMGGAGFPTHVKLSPPPEKPIDVIVLNGAECEPYLTCDHRLMLEEPQRVLKGLQILMHALSVKQGHIGIEDNKPDAIAALKAANSSPEIRINPLHTKYPQGAEKQLIFACTGREVPSGGLPMDIGVVVVNVATAATIARLFETGLPLIERVCTVTGDGVKQPKNLRFRIGVKLSDLIAYCGGYTEEEPGKVILGGPMMGVAQFTDAVQAIKNTSGVLVLTKAAAAIPEPSLCIKCGKCVTVCPVGLQPIQISAFSLLHKYDEAKSYNALDCIECGSCSFICPAKRPLLQSIRVAKREILAQRGKNAK